MNVWLVKTSEPVPLPGSAPARLIRAGLMARALVAQGHRVLWWNGTFDHWSRAQQFDRDTQVEVEPGLTVRFLHGRAYRKNLSLARMLNHRELAAKFLSQAPSVPRPDVIVCSYPTIEFSDAATAYGRAQSVPVLLDLRDMWPDIFPAHFPGWLQPLVRLALAPLYVQARRACRRATALLGITDDFLAWGLRRAGRDRTALDQTVPLAYPAEAPPPEELRAAETFWDQQGVPADRQVFTVSYGGSMGRQGGLGTVIEASRRLAARGVPHRLVLCGVGEREAVYREQARGLSHILLPGWVNWAQLHVLLRRSHVGFDPLPLRFDFLATINNKAVEFFSAGLAVVSCPRKGVLFRLLRDRQCGLSHDPGDVKGLEDLLGGLASDRDQVARMGANAAHTYQTMFVAEQVYGRLVRHLERVVGLPAGSG